MWCCFITVDVATAASRNGFCSYKLSLNQNSKLLRTWQKHRCGSWMFIPDPRSWIRIFPSRIPDPNFFHPGSSSKTLSILTPKNVSKLSEIWFGLFILDPDHDFYPSRIPEPGSRGQKDTGSRISDPDTQHLTENITVPTLLRVYYFYILS